MGAVAQRILVVDDDVMVCRLVGDILTRHGYETQTASGGKEALDKINSPGHYLPDLMVLDIMMPEMDGLEFYERVRRDPKTKHIPAIFLTAKADAGSRAKALMMGCFRFLQKPSSLKEISQSVSICLTDAEQTRALLAESDKTSEGSLGPETIPTTVDAFITGMWTGQLWILSGEEQGKIEFAGGKIHFVQWGGWEGAEALEAMLKLKEGSFKTLRE